MLLVWISIWKRKLPKSHLYVLLGYKEADLREVSFCELPGNVEAVWLALAVWFSLIFYDLPSHRLSGKESACQCRRQVWSLGQEDHLEKEMATHSSILAWEIPWTEEPGGLQSWGSKEWDMIEQLNNNNNNNNKSPFLSPLPHTAPCCSHTELLTCMPWALGTSKSPCFACAFPWPRRPSCLLCLAQILQPSNFRYHITLACN